jgi:phage host-nuclease inhibitor protein Gam
MLVTSRTQAERALQEIAALTAQHNGLTAARDAAVLAAQARHAAELAKLEAKLQEHSAAVEAWAKKDRKGWELQSLPLQYGTLEFRTSPPKLELLDEKKTPWKAVLATMLAALKTWGKFIRRKPEIDKRALLSAATGEKPALTAAMLAKLGVRVAQEETFSITLKTPEA